MEIFGYKFIIKKVKRKRKAKGFSAKQWSTSEKNTLLRLHGEHMSVEQIAKELNRTPASINSMIYKLHNKKESK